MELNEAANAAKNPASYSVITYCWVVALSLLGGISGAVRRAREDGRVTLLEIVGELSISAFAGVMTFYLCEWSGTDQLLSAALSACPDTWAAGPFPGWKRSGPSAWALTCLPIHPASPDRLPFAITPLRRGFLLEVQHGPHFCCRGRQPQSSGVSGHACLYRAWT